jgi:hypothetical protein
MASPAPNNDKTSSRQDNLATSNPQDNLPTSNQQDNMSTSNQLSKAQEDLIAYAAAHRYDPPRHEKTKRAPGDARKGHGGPIRITRTDDGVLTEYGEKLERERLARLAAANQGDEGEPGCHQ